MAILVLILALCGLIIVHECGHFFAAKLFGIRVEEFGIGFPPRLAATRVGETEYSLNVLLFGGFVRIYGEHMNEGGTTGSNPRSFMNRSRLVQAAVVISGIVMNIVLAWVIFSGVYMFGMPSEPDPTSPGSVTHVQLMIIAVLPESPAERTGLQGGDIVRGILTGTAELPFPATAEQAQSFVAEHADQSFVLKVLRGGLEKDFVLKPVAGLIQNAPEQKALGVEFDDVGTVRLPFFSALGRGASLTWEETKMTTVGLSQFFWELITGHADLSHIAGPIGIAKAGNAAATQGVVALLFFTAIISINLALINIIPIPGLDGGRLLFIVIEGVRRRAISERLQTRLTIAGFALLIALVAIISFHDILKL